MKRIYLYIAIIISLVANIIFYSNLKKNENKVVSQSEVVSDDYVSDELGKAYSYVKLNGKKLENVKGTLSYQDKTIGVVELESLIRGYNVVFYFSKKFRISSSVACTDPWTKNGFPPPLPFNAAFISFVYCRKSPSISPMAYL